VVGEILKPPKLFLVRQVIKRRHFHPQSVIPPVVLS